MAHPGVLRVYHRVRGADPGSVDRAGARQSRGVHDRRLWKDRHRPVRQASHRGGGFQDWIRYERVGRIRVHRGHRVEKRGNVGARGVQRGDPVRVTERDIRAAVREPGDQGGEAEGGFGQKR